MKVALWIVVGLVALMIGSGSVINYMAEKQEKEARADRADRIRAEWESFGAKRPELLQTARDALAKGDTQEVERLIGRFFRIGDADVTAVLNESRELAGAKRRQAAEAERIAKDKTYAQHLAEVQRVSKLSDAALCREIKKADASEAVLEAYRLRGGSPEHRGTIQSRQVTVGMRTLDARCAWGAPEDINRTTGAGYTHEQWVYGSGNYLYFDDGVLRTVQN